jgi:P-type Ca2+ transporter type 2C
MSDPGLRHQQKNPYQQSADDILAAFPSDSGHGLSESEARERLDKYGANELKAKKPVPGWKKFLAQFQNVLVVLLLVACHLRWAVVV